jgi:putative RNA 2'-phosphotransferase
MYQAAYDFYCSDNNVWLVDNVPHEYLQKIKTL